MTCLHRLCLLLVFMFGANAGWADCRVQSLATLPIDIADGHLLVSVAVNDVDATFILDTGAERTLMSEDSVRQLGVARDTWVASTILGIAGGERRPNALPRSLRLGGVPLKRKTLIGDTSVTVGPIPVTQAGGRSVVGLLGRDFLSPFDLDLDMPSHRMTLYDVRGCEAWFLPWTKAYASIPAATPVGNAMVIQTGVDEHPLRTLIDTGASSSLITAAGMFRLGITPEILAHDPTGNGRGIGPAPVPMHLHRFATLQVGPEVIRNPPLWVASIHVVPIVDMLLGMDWLRSRHVWFSFATRQVFVAAPS